MDTYIMQRKMAPFMQAFSDCKQIAEQEYQELVKDMKKVNPERAARLERANSLLSLKRYA